MPQARATESSSYTRFGRRVAFFARYQVRASDVGGSLVRSALYDAARFGIAGQDPIFHALVDTLAKDKPDLLVRGRASPRPALSAHARLPPLTRPGPALRQVVDRFAFGGVDAAHHLGLPYVINNPHMMLDVDAPSPAVPVPFSGHLHTVRAASGASPPTRWAPDTVLTPFPPYSAPAGIRISPRLTAASHPGSACACALPWARPCSASTKFAAPTASGPYPPSGYAATVLSYSPTPPSASRSPVNSCPCFEWCDSTPPPPFLL